MPGDRAFGDTDESGFAPLIAFALLFTMLHLYSAPLGILGAKPTKAKGLNTEPPTVWQ
jgi:hypothetical protein